MTTDIVPDGRRSTGIAGRSPGRQAARAAVAALLCLAWALALPGCATYSAQMADLRPRLAAGDFDGALRTIDEHGGGSDQLLSWLERGLVLHYADRYAESNEAFAAAERTAAERFDRSLAEGAISLLTSDANVAYRPRPFEMALVPYYKALNYAWLGQPSEAAVEARSASQMLAKYVDASLGAVREQDRGELERVRNDAFLLWFSGMLYEADGELNDAFIAYRNAAVAFEQNAGLLGLEAPADLAGDLARTADRLGFRAELEQAAQASPSVFAAAGDTTADLAVLRADARWVPGNGELVLLVETGQVPQLGQVRLDFPIFKGEDHADRDRWGWSLYDGYGYGRARASSGDVEYWLSIAAPELHDEAPLPCSAVRASAGTIGGHALGTRAAHLGRAARVSFDAEKPTIFFRSIVRGLTKYLASRGAEKVGGKGLGVLANILGAVTEKADTRSWLTLPGQVHVLRLHLPPGRHDVKLELLGATGRVVAEQTLAGIVVKPGEWTFESRRVFALPQ
ncbi:MAG: hypothetical protein IPO18_10560 [bacterium]|nr:hypothetical protein [bacterium]